MDIFLRKWPKPLGVILLFHSPYDRIKMRIKDALHRYTFIIE